VAVLPGLVGTNERPSGQGEVEGEGPGNAVRRLEGQAFEIGGLPAEPVSKISCGDYGTPFAALQK